MTSPDNTGILGTMECSICGTNLPEVCEHCLNITDTTGGFEGKNIKYYQQFLLSREPMKLVEELARLRTYILMYQEQVNQALKIAEIDGSPKLMNSALWRLREVSEMVDIISKVAKRSKEIEEGITVKVDIDVQVLSRFIFDVVFAHVKDDETRRAIMESSRSFQASQVNQVGLNILKAGI